MSWQYYPALDGIRTVAVYLVVAFHAGLAWLDGGFVGVDVFFVLSGFVVGNVLLAEATTTGRLALGRFYARRVRRLLPAAVLVIVVTSLVFVLLAPLARRTSLIDDAQSALLYVANWHFVGQSEDYFAEGVQRSPFLHFWSLGVEEQFYLLLPVLLLGLVALGRRTRWPRTLLAAGLALLLLLSLAAQLYWTQVDPAHAYYGTDARLYQLLTGVLLAVLLQSPWLSEAASRGRRPAVMGVAGVLGLALLTTVPGVGATWRSIGTAAVTALLITAVMSSQQGLLARLLARPGPSFLGRVSYSTYLWHWPVILALGEVLTTRPLVIALLAAGVSTGLAALSYELYEMPIRSSAVMARFQWRAVLSGVTASALVAAVVVPQVLQVDTTPSVTGKRAGPTRTVAVKDQTEPIPDVDWQALREKPFRTRNCTPDHPARCRIRQGEGPDVLLVGDSHAMMVLPAFKRLARKHDLGLSVNALPGCMWQQGLINTRSPQRREDACTEQRVGWYEKALPRLDPDVVILIGRPFDNPNRFGKYVHRRDGTKQSLATATRRETYRTLRQVSAKVPQVLVVDPIVVPENFDPLDCLSGARSAARCTVPLGTAPSPSAGYYAAAAARLDNVATLNLTDAFCPDAPVCQPVVDGTVVWRDPGHLTTRFARQRAAQVWQRLQQTDAFSASG